MYSGNKRMRPFISAEVAWSLSLTLLIAFSLFACAPTFAPSDSDLGLTRLDDQAVVVSDGARLPLRRWLPEERPRAIIVAVHGYTDYRNAFALPAPFLAAHGIAVFAYDQRGFGASPGRGQWPGRDALVRDLAEIIHFLRGAWGDLPLFVLGDSMGAAVSITALSDPEIAKSVQGLILNAPAVWGAETFNPFYRASLWLLAHTIPWYETGGKGVRRTISDNRDLLRQMADDPLLLRNVRIESLYGLVHLMDRALNDAHAVQVPVLLLYGRKDEVIPINSICRLRRSLNADANVAFYDNGYHLLLRDLQAIHVWRDIVLWVNGVSLGTPIKSADPCYVESVKNES